MEVISLETTYGPLQASLRALQNVISFGTEALKGLVKPLRALFGLSGPDGVSKDLMRAFRNL